MKLLYFASLYCYYYYLTNTAETSASPLFFSFFLRCSWMWLHAPGVHTLEQICNKTDRENSPNMMVVFVELGFSLLSDWNMSQCEFHLEMCTAASWCQELPLTGLMPIEPAGVCGGAPQQRDLQQLGFAGIRSLLLELDVQLKGVNLGWVTWAWY